jgi:hypothetical protein
MEYKLWNYSLFNFCSLWVFHPSEVPIFSSAPCSQIQWATDSIIK